MREIKAWAELLSPRKMPAPRISTILLPALMTVAMAQPSRAEIVDRIVAVISSAVSGGPPAAGQIITWSAAYEEACFLALQNGTEPPLWTTTQSASSNAINAVVSRMVDQTLLLQALSRSPFAPSTEADVQGRSQEIEKRFPDAQSFRAELARYHLTEAALTRRLSRESLIMAYVDSTLRPEVNISSDQIESYYHATFVPELLLRGQAGDVPSVDELRDRIKEILTQQEIDRRLEQWLTDLRRSAKIELRL